MRKSKTVVGSVAIIVTLFQTAFITERSKATRAYEFAENISLDAQNSVDDGETLLQDDQLSDEFNNNPIQNDQLSSQGEIEPLTKCRLKKMNNQEREKKI